MEKFFRPLFFGFTPKRLILQKSAGGDMPAAKQTQKRGNNNETIHAAACIY
jgi:hypothetical protein